MGFQPLYPALLPYILTSQERHTARMQVNQNRGISHPQPFFSELTY